MSDAPDPRPDQVVSAHLTINAPTEVIFELIADPAQQPRWDGNGNLGQAESGQRVRDVGDVFVMTNANGKVRQNRVVEFVEGRRIAWLPGEVDAPSPGHLWRWELEPVSAGSARVTHTYDWSGLTDERRIPKAQATTSANLMASLERLKDLAES